jgi:hypothetical protein
MRSEAYKYLPANENTCVGRPDWLHKLAVNKNTHTHAHTLEDPATRRRRAPVNEDQVLRGLNDVVGRNVTVQNVERGGFGEHAGEKCAMVWLHSGVI